MRLNNLESAWKQMKLLNAMDDIDSNEVLAIIGQKKNLNAGKWQRLSLNVIMFVFLLIICQGG